MKELLVAHDKELAHIKKQNERALSEVHHSVMATELRFVIHRGPMAASQS